MRGHRCVLFVCVCVCAYVQTHLYVGCVLFVYVCVYVHARLYTCTHMHTHAHTCTHMHTRAHAHTLTLRVHGAQKRPKKFWAFFSPSKHTICVTHTHTHTHIHTHTAAKLGSPTLIRNIMFWDHKCDVLGGKECRRCCARRRKRGLENCAANILARRMLFRASCD